MNEVNSIKNQCLVILDYYVKIKYGGENCISIWNWQKETLSNIEENSSLGKKQISCVCSDTIEGIRDFDGEKLKNLMVFSIENAVELNLGKTKSKRVINFFLKEKQLKNAHEFYVLKRLYSFYGEDLKLQTEDKKNIEAMLGDYLIV